MHPPEVARGSWRVAGLLPAMRTTVALAPRVLQERARCRRTTQRIRPTPEVGEGVFPWRSHDDFLIRTTSKAVLVLAAATLQGAARSEKWKNRYLCSKCEKWIISRKVDHSRKNGLRETSFAEIRKRDPGTCVASGPERSHIQLPQATARATAAPRPVWRLGLTNARGRRSLTVTHRTPESRQFAAHCHSRHVTDHSASDDVTDRHASASFYHVSQSRASPHYITTPLRAGGTRYLCPPWVCSASDHHHAAGGGRRAFDQFMWSLLKTRALRLPRSHCDAKAVECVDARSGDGDSEAQRGGGCGRQPPFRVARATKPHAAARGQPLP